MGMAVDDRLECFGDVGGRVDVVELAGGDDRREQRPVFRADFMTGEERIFSGQADWPDGVLDRVRVAFQSLRYHLAELVQPFTAALATRARHGFDDTFDRQVIR